MVDTVAMSADEILDDRERNTVSVHGRKQAEIEVEGEQLLPGISNEITIDHIASKLPWRAFHSLAPVSRGWRHAIGSHQVHDARVRSKSTQTILLYDDWHTSHRQSMTGGSTFLLYCVEDDTCHYLPHIPGVKKGIPPECESISLDGKLYILGGNEDFGEVVRPDVYVLDLAGQRRWKKCANMKEGRIRFGCGVKDGKIYVFGGLSNSKSFCGSEVYDPKEDAWSPINTIPLFRVDFQVATLGEELFLHNGLIYNPKRLPSGLANVGNVVALSAEVYHPRKDEWRIVEHFSRCDWDRVVMVGGKFHRLNQAGLQVYDIQSNSWGPSHPISFTESGQSRCISDVASAVVMKDEILAMVYVDLTDEEEEAFENYDTDMDSRACLITSQGLGGKESEIVWKILPFTVHTLAHFMCHIQL